MPSVEQAEFTEQAITEKLDGALKANGALILRQDQIIRQLTEALEEDRALFGSLAYAFGSDDWRAKQCLGRRVGIEQALRSATVAREGPA